MKEIIQQMLVVTTRGEHLIQFGISEIYGELPNGHYRLVKCFWPENEGLDAKFYLSVEFDIE